MTNQILLDESVSKIIKHPIDNTPNVYGNCKPLLKWPGGKTSELKEIIPRIPEHNRYFEPFFGGGALFFNTIIKTSFVNDLHADLMFFYKCIRNENAEFYSLLKEFVLVWEESDDKQSIYMKVRKRYNSTNVTNVQKAVDFFILREYAYGGMFRLNAKGEFNVPFGHIYINKNIQKKIDCLSSVEVVSKLKNSALYNLDFKDFAKKFIFTKNDFMFVDPPYNCSFSKYDDDDFGIDDQKRLANFLMNFKGNFMLVIQYTDLIKQLYNNKMLHTHVYPKTYKFNIKGRFNRDVNHALITNYATNI